jgi:hypothetical protein
MSHSAVAKSSDSLLRDSPKQVDSSATLPLSSTTQMTIKVLAILRLVTGTACLIAPHYTGVVFKYNIPAESTLLVRMTGVRDVVLGELLITAEDKDSRDGGRRQVCPRERYDQRANYMQGDQKGDMGGSCDGSCGHGEYSSQYWNGNGWKDDRSIIVGCCSWHNRIGHVGVERLVNHGTTKPEVARKWLDDGVEAGM